MNDSASFDNKKNKILIISLISIFILLVSGVTYALVSSMDVINPGHIVQSKCFHTQYSSLNADGTQDIDGVLMPSSTPRDGVLSTIQMAMDDSCDVITYGNLYVQINNGDNVDTLVKTVSPHCENKETLETLPYSTEESCLSSDKGVWVTNGTALKYAVYFNGDANPSSVGYINNYDKEINIYKNFRILSMDTANDRLSDFSYNILIWLDGNLTDNSYLSISFSGYTFGTFTQSEFEILSSILDPGMIPVVFSYDEENKETKVKTISEDDDSWYNYDEKKWANVVLVKEDSRSNYLNTSGVEVNQDDILAYYVWIPRYKYKIFTEPPIATGNKNDPVTIDVVFESVNEKSTGKNVGEYYTHPAFTFNGKNLPGIWVAKFETVEDGDGEYKIIPGKQPIVGWSVLNQFMTSLNFAGRTYEKGGTVILAEEGGLLNYGLTSKADSHMMKNSEWGAVTYLSHSKYGINGEVSPNPLYIKGDSFAGYGVTGCGISENAVVVVTDNNFPCEIPYGEAVFYPQSTTGNITGIFDMSGGAPETVMANLDGYIGSGSGFSGINADGGKDLAGTYYSTPNAQYIDYYDYDIFSEGTSSYEYCTLETCGGHALYETAGWYDNLAMFFNDGNPWLVRGSYYMGGTSWNSGLFTFGKHNGGGDSGKLTAFRNVVLPNIYK